MRHLPLALLTSVLSLILVAGMTAQDKVVITDPAKINDDYRFQGEYLGDFKKDGTPTKIGIQVIAMGNGTFQFRIHADGLPGAGWKRGDDMSMAKGTRNGDVVNVTTDEAESYDYRLNDGVMIISAGDRLLGKLKKVERTSKTLGKEPPAGAVVLFDG